MAQISLSLDIKEVRKLDDLAGRLGLSRSAALRLLVTGALRQPAAIMGMIVAVAENTEGQ